MDESTIEGLIAKYVKNGSVVSIGTSHLGEQFLRQLVWRLEQQDLSIFFVPTSMHLAEIATELHLPVVSIDESEIDLAIEFADQIDEQYNFLKTDSHSLVRDKMICQSADELVVVCEKKNFVKKLNGSMAVEITPFGYKRTLLALEKLGPCGLKTVSQRPFLTESGNYLAVIKIDEVYSPEDINFSAKEIPGVIETGLFIGYADRLILYNPGIEVKSRMR
ncbi:MAG: ribose-5-phosphate isomerase A [Candidatus Micrarchaeota archaeon]